MEEEPSVEALLTKLRESRLSSDQRRTSLDTLRTALDPLTTGGLDTSAQTRLIGTVKAAIKDGANDVRRVVLQTLTSCIEAGHLATDTEQGQAAVNELIDTIDLFLRSTLKVQSSKSTAIPSRASTDVASLPTSSLRATAAALKALCALIRILPQREKPPARGAPYPTRGLFSLFEVLLPCFSAGVQLQRQSSPAMPRSGSSLPSGAFSWNEQARPARIHSSQKDRFVAPSTSIQAAPAATDALHSFADYSSSGETDRRSDKSESERSDFSVASASTTFSRSSRKDESRQQEAMTKLIRQNSLHCLMELNRHEARALIARWGELLPDQPAPVLTSKATDKPVSAIPRVGFASPTSAHAFSICTLIIQDPSTSVRMAAMQALESILSRGTLQLSMAQERAQRALTFTSLSSQLASWIVNVRSYLVVALQRAASAARASGGGEAAAATYPSSLALALLQLTHTFVTSTAKAKLVMSNAAVLSPMVVPFASHSDPDVQSAAKRLVATLTAVPKGNAGKEVVTRADVPARDAFQKTAISQAEVSTRTSPMELTAVLSQANELTAELCDQVLRSLQAADDSILSLLPVWTVWIKSVVDAPPALLGSEAYDRLAAVWHKMSSSEPASPDQQCGLLATVPDLVRVLSRHAAPERESWAFVLQYVQTCCGDRDEAVRAAAVRVLGLLVLAPETIAGQAPVPTAADGQQRRLSALLHDVLWGNSGGAGGIALHDHSSLVRQRASWALSNAMEARLRSGLLLDERDWLEHARYCLEAGRDMEGVAVSACRASGSLLAMLPPIACTEALSLARSMLEQLCRVLGTTSKPPKSRWNAASALERALCSEVVLTRILVASEGEEGMLDRTVGLLCSNLDAKVFKIRVSVANALLSLCLGAEKASSQGSSASRLELLGAQRRARVQQVAAVRLGELAQASASKESALYVDELKRLLSRLVASLE